MTSPVDPTSTPAWATLTGLADGYRPNLREAFAADPERAQRLSLSAGDLFVDLSKNLVDDQILAALLGHANEVLLTSVVVGIAE